MIENFVWAEKYRPQTLDDIILPVRYREMFTGFVDGGNIPNLIFSGPPGIGKTTLAKVLVSELGASSLLINGSKDGTKDTLRNEIQSFVTTKSLSNPGKRKYVIFDEAEGISPATQNALRSFMEEFSAHVGFIFTCNNSYKLIEAIRESRCSVIDFSYSSKEKGEVLQQTWSRIQELLDKESVPYDKSVLLKIITQKFPDIRGTINEIQKYVASNTAIDSGILEDLADSAISEVMALVKAKNFNAVVSWVNENQIEDSLVYTYVYNHAKQLVSAESMPTLIMIIAEYQKYSNQVANRNINTAAALMEISTNCEFK